MTNRFRPPCGQARPMLIFCLLSATMATTLSDASANADVHPWSGMYFNGFKHPYQDGQPRRRPSAAEASITVPCLPDTAPAGTYYAWVGLGGVWERPMVRAGLAARLVRDGDRVEKSYFAFGEYLVNRPAFADTPRGPRPRSRVPSDGARIDVGGDNLAITCNTSVFFRVHAGGDVIVGTRRARVANYPARWRPRFSSAQFVVQDAVGAPLFRAAGGAAMDNPRVLHGTSTLGVGELACLQGTVNPCAKWVQAGVNVVPPSADRPSNLCFRPAATRPAAPPPGYPGELFPGGDARPVRNLC
ncbi:hypothetical protein ACIBH1_42085 [Nonomuraea sp. NPDC050663]|uniref:hypothetical protein n=1 Tax=Nonomuraea sp. NPDC050663 TaxID=3364370 RepID=UPI00379C2A97